MNSDHADNLPTPSEDQARALLEACVLAHTTDNKAEGQHDRNFSLDDLRCAVADQN